MRQHLHWQWPGFCFDRQLRTYIEMCSSDQLPTIAPSHCQESYWFSQLFPPPISIQSNYLNPLPVRNKAQSRLKRSGKRRKVIKGKLMAQQSLLGALLKWALLFLPYQSHLAQGIFDGFLVASFTGERSRWRILPKYGCLAGGLLTRDNLRYLSSCHLVVLISACSAK